MKNSNLSSIEVLKKVNKLLKFCFSDVIFKNAEVKIPFQLQNPDSVPCHHSPLTELTLLVSLNSGKNVNFKINLVDKDGSYKPVFNCDWSEPEKVMFDGTPPISLTLFSAFAVFLTQSRTLFELYFQKLVEELEAASNEIQERLDDGHKMLKPFEVEDQLDEWRNKLSDQLLTVDFEHRQIVATGEAFFKIEHQWHKPFVRTYPIMYQIEIDEQDNTAIKESFHIDGGVFDVSSRKECILHLMKKVYVKDGKLFSNVFVG